MPKIKAAQRANLGGVTSVFNIGDKFEIKISGVFVIEGRILYAAEGIKDYLFDEDELKILSKLC